MTQLATVEILNRRILIIDDNESIHDDFKKILASQQPKQTDLRELESMLFGETTTVASDGFELDYADQGKAGFDKVQYAIGAGNPYAIAFVDMRMPPGWDGLETINQIWKIDQEIQIVICTAMSDYSWSDITKKLGLSDRLLILKRPFDNMEVLQLAHSLSSKWELTHQAAQQVAALNDEVRAGTLALRGNETKLQHIVNAAPDAIITLDNNLIVHVQSAQAMCTRRQTRWFFNLMNLTAPRPYCLLRSSSSVQTVKMTND